MKKTYGVLLVIMLICNCATTKKGSKSQTLDEGKKGLINENFDPLILNDDDIIVKKRIPVEAKSDFDDSLVKNMEEGDNSQMVIQGYRVQICAVSDKEAARDIQREAILKFNDNIYLIYDSPYYKVRIGDCTSRFEADKLQQLAIEKGFDDAWVVKTKVNPQSKSQSEEESLEEPY